MLDDDKNQIGFVERMKLEQAGKNSLSKELVEMEKRTQLGYLLKVCVKLGREISEEEMEALGNIL